ncbi:MAG TPA: hypothetical protein VEW08_03290 [Steroidobacteraceae bacterium]|nr:hypothetical protein [Steroidobacteraceae bacterium]
MHRAACFTLLLALIVSHPVAADDKKFGTAIRDAIAKEVHERKEAEASNAKDEQDLPVVANVGDRKRSVLHGVLWGGSDDSLRVATCPMGSAGAPTFDEVRNYYRDYSDDEMWKICVNRSTYQGAIPGACACSLLAYPNPWRPVETTRQSEQPDEPIANPEPEDSDK